MVLRREGFLLRLLNDYPNFLKSFLIKKSDSSLGRLSVGGFDSIFISLL